MQPGVELTKLKSSDAGTDDARAARSPAAKESTPRAADGGVSQKPSQLIFLGGIVLAVFAGVGFVVGFALLLHVLLTADTWVPSYQSGLVAMWGGFGGAWFGAPLAVWWLSPYFNAHHSRCGHYAACVLGALLALFGVIGFCGWAASQAEAGSAVAILLFWVPTGALAVSMSATQLADARVSPEGGTQDCGELVRKGGDDADTDAEKGEGTPSESGGKGGDADSEAPSSQHRRRCCCACTCRVAVICVGWFFLLWGLVFTGGVAINGVLQAAGEAAHPPLGTVYEISAAPEYEGSANTLRLHMFCDGTADAPNKPTVVLSHGGGASCVSMVGIQQDLIARGFRACVYDRPGYGWSETYYRRESYDVPFPGDGQQLVRLMAAAGESGPFACGGHSAGASVCLQFAIASPDVKSVVGIDGFPDVVRGGSYRPGLYDPDADPRPEGLLPYTFFAGPTGLSRGLLGTASDDFVPAELAGAYSSLYAQERFWLTQYWDLKTDKRSGDSGFVFPTVPGGFQNQTTGHVYYGNSLNVSVRWLVAAGTVNATCSDELQWNEWCCGGATDAWCQTKAPDAAFYTRQAQLYADTISLAQGKVFQSEWGYDHGFAQQAHTVPWIGQHVAEAAVELL